MSVTYSPVKWNRNKRIYDATLACAMLVYLTLFLAVSRLTWRGAEAIADEVLLIRAFGTGALVLLHVVLCIGPLARLDRRLLPLLYNRRHLGVATFSLALAHGALATGYYHGFGRVHPLVSLLTSNTNFDSWNAFPFEMLGLLALLILFLLAATSHDFWQRNVGPSLWKSLHMLIYVAYGLVVMHVALGALQSERSLFYPAIMSAGVATLVTLHIAAGWRERARDRSDDLARDVQQEIWIDVGAVDEIVECRAKVVAVPGHERVAVFRYGNQISAVTNVCAH
jgi:sulfoxide reductase heme-binding subunit YedZ